MIWCCFTTLFISFHSVPGCRERESGYFEDVFFESNTRNKESFYSILFECFPCHKQIRTNSMWFETIIKNHLYISIMRSNKIDKFENSTPAIFRACSIHFFVLFFFYCFFISHSWFYFVLRLLIANQPCQYAIWWILHYYGNIYFELSFFLPGYFTNSKNS